MHTGTTGHKLRKNRSGRWELRYTERCPDGSWRTRTVSTGCFERSEAEQWKTDFLNNNVRLASVSGVPLLGAVIDAYEKAKPAQKYNLVAPRRLLGGYAVDVLTPAIVDEYVRTRTRVDGCASGSARKELALVTAALNWAVSKKTLGVRREIVPEIDLPPPGTPRTLFLDEDQEPLFHAWAMGLSVGSRRLHRLTLFVGLGLDTAARSEALHDLTWDRVDLVRRKIDFRVPGKLTGNKRRTVVAISSRLFPLLERAHREWLADGGARGTPVVGAGSIRTTWETHVERGSAWPWMTPHLMRHTWAKLHARAGVPLFDIAGVLGDTYETVARNYLHDCPVKGTVVDKRWEGV